MMYDENYSLRFTHILTIPDVKTFYFSFIIPSSLQNNRTTFIEFKPNNAVLRNESPLLFYTEYATQTTPIASEEVKLTAIMNTG